MEFNNISKSNQELKSPFTQANSQIDFTSNSDLISCVGSEQFRNFSFPNITYPFYILPAFPCYSNLKNNEINLPQYCENSSNDNFNQIAPNSELNGLLVENDTKKLKNDLSSHSVDVRPNLVLNGCCYYSTPDLPLIYQNGSPASHPQLINLSPYAPFLYASPQYQFEENFEPGKYVSQNFLHRFYQFNDIPGSKNISDHKLNALLDNNNFCHKFQFDSNQTLKTSNLPENVLPHKHLEEVLDKNQFFDHFISNELSKKVMYESQENQQQILVKDNFCRLGDSLEIYPGYPVIFISKNGMLCISLRLDILIEMTFDNAIRVIDRKNNMIISTSNTGNEIYVNHKCGQIKQQRTNVKVCLTDGRKILMRTGEIIFNYPSSFKTNYSVSDDGVLMYRPDEILDKIEPEESMNILCDHSMYGSHLFDAYQTSVDNAYYKFYNSGSVTLHLNNVRIHQTKVGYVHISSGKKQIRISPVHGSARLITHFVDINIEPDSKVKLKRGGHKILATRERLVMANDKMEFGFNSENQLFFQPHEAVKQTIISQGHSVLGSLVRNSSISLLNNDLTYCKGTITPHEYLKMFINEDDKIKIHSTQISVQKDLDSNKLDSILDINKIDLQFCGDVYKPNSSILISQKFNNTSPRELIDFSQQKEHIESGKTDVKMLNFSNQLDASKSVYCFEEQITKLLEN